MKEEWKPIDRFDGRIYVSSFGRIRTAVSSRIVKQHVRKNGYVQVSIKLDGRLGKTYCLRIHREVALAFIPNPDNKKTVNHIDGSKTNNYASNLEWATHSENIKHAFAMGLAMGLKGEESHRSKLTREQVDYILNNTTISNAEFGRMYGVHRSAISKVRRKIHWNK